MKTRPLLLTVGVLALSAFSLSPALAQNANAAQKAFAAALDAEKAGNVELAKQQYQKTLKLHPGHARAQYRLGELKIHKDRIVADAKQREIESVMIPEIRLDDAEFGEAVQALGLMIEKSTEEKIFPNFIIQDPSGTLAKRKVTLVLKNAPAGTIMKHMLAMAKAKARYDKHAVVIMPL